jgi:putative ABC transport system ATP-binding protein
MTDLESTGRIVFHAGAFKPFCGPTHQSQDSNNSQIRGSRMLQMTHIKKIYRTQLIETHALRELTLKVSAGEFVAVTGPSGSGKTTFLNIAGLLESFEHGTYMLDGKDVSRLSDDDRSVYRNQKIGFIFQSFNLIPDLNLFDNVDVPLRYRRLPKADRKQRIEHALETVGLASRMKHIPAQLSGGQQQRVAIARALAGDPKVLLADEPTGNLDTGMAHQVMDLLEQIHAVGTTIVMVTHDPDLASRAERNIHLMDGRVACEELIEAQEEIPQATPIYENEPLVA